MGADNDPAVRLEDVHIIRHTFKPCGAAWAGRPDRAAGPRIHQGTGHLAPSLPFVSSPILWVILIADGRRRSRLWGTFENHGEVAEERTEASRCFDLRPSGFLAPLTDRLVVEWDNPRSWHRSAGSVSAAGMPVVEIAGRDNPGMGRGKRVQAQRPRPHQPGHHESLR
jgi:hypothetical protein